MRLLFVTHTLAPRERPQANVGGMQRVAAELHTALAADPEVELATLALRSSERWLGVRTAGFIATTAARLPALARRHDAEAVLFSSISVGALAPLVRRRMPAVGLATIVHGRDVLQPDARLHPYQRWLPRAFGALDLVLPISEATARACVERGAPRERIRVVGNGVDLARFQNLPSKAEARRALLERLGLPGDAFVLVSIGRQVRRKGTAWFVEHVMPRLPERVHYVVAGGGPQSEAIAAVVEAAGLGGRVHPLGRVSEAELAGLLRGGDLFVMPNVPVEGDMEGFGVVMLEAGLCGLPVLASALEGIRDVVAEGVSGHLVPPLDAEAFAGRVRHYAADRAALDTLAERARRYVEATYAWPAVARRYVEALRRIVPRR